LLRRGTAPVKHAEPLEWKLVGRPEVQHPQATELPTSECAHMNDMARGANIQNPRQPLALPAKEALCDLSTGETGLVAVVISACARLILRLQNSKRKANHEVSQV